MVALIASRLADLGGRFDAWAENRPGFRVCGRVERAVGVLLEASGLSLPVGSRCQLELPHARVPAEVVGFSGERSYLMPLASSSGVYPGVRVQPDDDLLPPAEALLGRVIDALGRPLDGRPLPAGAVARQPRLPINPLDRKPISESLDVGVRCINALLRVGVGQRLGLFAGSGVGKSVLLGMLARFTRADVVVVGLIGERGREVQEFLEDNLGEGLARAVVVAAPADESASLRLRGAMLATEIAEAFRAQGRRVLLLMDSLTRVAQAQREIGLAMGEPPAAKGYTPSVFALLPQLVERSGQTRREGGSITAFYTVLMEEDDLQDPVVDSARAILDGHIVLSRRLAERGHYPAIDVPASISRLMNKLSADEDLNHALRFKRLWSRFAEQEDLISVGAYKSGADQETDEAVARHQEQTRFLQQDPGQPVALDESLRLLRQLFSRPPVAAGDRSRGAHGTEKA
ncbi:MAG: FliI/YscN family ATPase [Pseudomonadales bacterium]